MTVTDLVVTVSVLFMFGVIVYSRIKNQTLKETIDEVKEIFQGEE